MVDVPTTGTSITELIQAEIVEQSIKDYLIDLPVISPLAQYRSLAGRGTTVCSFPLWTKDAGADVTDGTGMETTEFETTQVSVTVAEVGIARELTNMAQKTSILGGAELFQVCVQDGAQLVVEMLEDDLAALFASATGGTIGTSGSDLSLANIAEVVAKARTLKLRGQIVGVLDDQQALDLVSSLMATTGTALNGNVDQTILESRTDGYLGTLMRMPMWVTNLTDTANAGADVVGSFFIAASSNEKHCPYSWCDVGTPQVFSATAPKMPSIVMSTSYIYGVAITYPAAAMKIVTDA